MFGFRFIFKSRRRSVAVVANHWAQTNVAHSDTNTAYSVAG